jgi:hypothetical protein
LLSFPSLLQPHPQQRYFLQDSAIELESVDDVQELHDFLLLVVEIM